MCFTIKTTFAKKNSYNLFLLTWVEHAMEQGALNTKEYTDMQLVLGLVMAVHRLWNNVTGADSTINAVPATSYSSELTMTFEIGVSSHCLSLKADTHTL